MLNRRHLRVKALQALYAFYNTPDLELKIGEKALLSSIDKIYDLYLFLLLTLTELGRHTDEIISNKISPDHQPAASSVSNNKIFTAISENPEFNKKLTENKKLTVQEDILNSLYKDLKSKERFDKYIAIEDHSLDSDVKFALFIFRKVILKSELLNQYLDDHYINWSTDGWLVVNTIIKTISKIEENSKEILLPLSNNWKEDKEFVIDLYRKTIINDKEFLEMISGKTKNWEIDRIAFLDIILMKMALCELLEFNSIPVKVSINEYIELSKDFSTPKSKIFINGVLDNLFNDLQKQGKVKKLGRGLKN